ncbi:hypothetical protein DEO72_LG3g1621 [Vigna unguiculata]|uniref:Uncharacterized protein n=1 Tax=Vigna unguiculata TaxID=3917 RepID=A0A4D6LF12_VIGUN|nr:hypothetical protein DEO72_LG3g1621 [Vigna unguiculata]
MKSLSTTLAAIRAPTGVATLFIVERYVKSTNIVTLFFFAGFGCERRWKNVVVVQGTPKTCGRFKKYKCGYGLRVLVVDIVGIGCYFSNDSWTSNHKRIVLESGKTNEIHDLHTSNRGNK